MTPSSFDLALEAHLDPGIVPPGPFEHSSRPAAVFLTGGTGFLGAFVIADLLRFTNARVYCLVRAADTTAARQRLADNLAHYELGHPGFDARVVALPGDVERPHFGLDDATYELLATHVESIYHLAASVSFMPGYEQMKAINVAGLTHVLQLACDHRTKIVHYTSTYAVFNADAYALAETVFETRLTGSGDGFIRGYDRSKWVAEQIVRVAQDRGVPVNVYRAGYISGDSSTAIHNKMDPVALMFAVTLCTGCVFDIDALLHLTPVDYCSAALVQLSLNPNTTNGIFHLVQEHPLSCEQIIEWLRDEGYQLDRVQFPEWYERLKVLCRRDPQFMPVLYLFSLKSGQPFGEGENISALRFDASNVHRHLDAAYHCPKLQSALLRRYFNYIASTDRGYQVIPRQLSAVRA
jgi:thioester reductase-like protein